MGLNRRAPVCKTQLPPTFLAALLLIAVHVSVNAQSIPTPAQTVAPFFATPSATSASPALCLARLQYLIPLDADGLGMARSYLMTIAPLSSSAGRASGTISIYDEANRWDISFVNAIAAADGQTPDPTPIVIRFPRAVRLDSGRIGSLDGPDGGPCRPLSVAAVASAQLTSAFARGIVAKAASAQAIDVPKPVPDKVAGCAQPDVRAHLLKAVIPDTPEISKMNGDAGTAQILVWLDDTGRPFAANVFRSSTSHQLDDAALGAAISSTYSPGAHDCRAISDSYMFPVDFLGIR